MFFFIGIDVVLILIKGFEQGCDFYVFSFLSFIGVIVVVLRVKKDFLNSKVLVLLCNNFFLNFFGVFVFNVFLVFYGVFILQIKMLSIREVSKFKVIKLIKSCNVNL